MDIAALGFSVDSSQAKGASGDLNLLTESALKAERATDSLGDTSKTTGSSLQKEGGTAESTTGSFRRMASVIAGVDTLNRRMAATSNLSGRAMSSLGGEVSNLERLMGSLIDEAQRTNLALSSMADMGGSRVGGGRKRPFKELADDIEEAGKKTKIANHHLTNMGYQFQDIGVQLAGGQNPLLIMVQQGSQLSQIFAQISTEVGGTRAAVNGLAGAFRGLVGRIAGLFPPILAIIGTYKTFMSDFRKGGDLTEGMKLTKEQLDLVGSKVVTFGDVVRATAKVAAEDFKKEFGPAIDWVGQKYEETSKYIGKAMGFIMDRAWEASALVAGVFNVAIKNVTDNWRLFPSVLGDIFFTAVNTGIKALEGLINKGIEGLNVIIKARNKIDPFFDVPVIGGVKFGQLDNPYKGQAAQLGATIADEFLDGYNHQMGIRGRIRNLSEEIGRERIEQEAHSKDKKQKDGDKEREREARDWSKIRRNDGITLEPLSVRVDDLNAKLKLTPGLIDPVKQKWDIAAKGVSSFAQDISYAIGDAAVGFNSLGDGVSNILRNWMAQWIAMKAMGFLGLGSDGSLTKGGFAEKATSWVSKTFSFDGGGYTGSGSRSGGIDGKGGFPAILHPQETVVDHTRGQSGGSVFAPQLTFNGVDMTRKLASDVNAAIAKSQRKVLRDARSRLKGWNTSLATHGM